jgi:hypothetical protein
VPLRERMTRIESSRHRTVEVASSHGDGLKTAPPAELEPRSR